jgi:hypothetical protein
MTPILDMLFALPVLALAGWGLWRAARGYWRFRGRRVVACPESAQFAAVDFAVWRIAATAAFRRPALVLRDCSRWQQGVLCGEACVKRIAEAPDACRVTTIVSEWYRDKTCACCGRPLGQAAHFGRHPCLMSPDLHIVEWKAIQAEDIPQVLSTHAPVCWTCLVAETHTS